MSSDSSSERTLDRILNERRDKAERLREHGRNPYRNDVAPSHSCAEVRVRYADTKPAEPKPGINPVDGEVIRLAGRVMAKRGFGKTVFAPIRDTDGHMQLFLNVEHVHEQDFKEVVPLMDAGDIVWAEGAIFWTKRGEMSLLCKRVEIVTKSLRPLPEKWHGLTDVEIRYRQRYLDLAVNPDVRDVFVKRSRIVKGIRRFLDSRGFLEVETPMMHPIIGGAAARPFVTHHNALDRKLYMRIAPELYLKRLVVGGFERVYEINRNFRNEGLSRRHNPEFTMLEFYQAYATYETLIDLTEELITELAQEVNGSLRCVWDGVDVNLQRPWKRLSVREAVAGAGVSEAVFDDPKVAAHAAIERGVGAHDVVQALAEGLEPAAAQELDANYAEHGGLFKGYADGGLRPEITNAIVERYASPVSARVRAGAVGFLLFEHVAEADLVQPTFLTDFPVALSPLARKQDSDPAFCDRFELFVCAKEIANAFSELNDADDQRRRFQAQLTARARGAQETMDYDEDYCMALELGMPPAAGEGIGIDRLAMLLTGQASIRDVILFPLLRSDS